MAVKFPLTFHKGSGQFKKKHKGRVYYFGSNQEEALRRYTNEWPDIIAGRVPAKVEPGSLTLRELVNEFLAAKRQQFEGCELSAVAWSDYHRVCELTLAGLGANVPVTSLQSDDFNRLLAGWRRKYAPVTVAGLVQRIKTIFKWGHASKKIAVPADFGPLFKKPKRRTMRLARAEAPLKLFEAEELRLLITNANGPLRAAILLAINCGYGSGDCSELRKSALKAGGWISAPRPKTGVLRRCKLWPETVEALREVISNRPAALDPADDDCVFVTRLGKRFTRFIDRGEEKRGSRTDGFAQAFGKLQLATGVRPRGFYCLRHTFRTVADRCRDQVAIGVTMGHVDYSISDTYREKIDDDRLEAVAEVVHRWLFG